MSNPLAIPAYRSPVHAFRHGQPRPVSVSEGRAVASLSKQVGYFFFLLVNILLFIRPEEIVPQFGYFPTYEAVIILCMGFSMPALYEQVRPSMLCERPITLLAVMMVFAVMFSHLFCPWNFLFIWGARMSAYKFLKILVYYLLLVGLLNTPAQLRRFLFWLGTIILVLTMVTLLQWYEVINLPNIDVKLIQWEETDPNTGERIGEVQRLQSTGVYNDPNDFCLILVVGIAISLYGLREPRMQLLRPMWLAAIVVFGHAIFLTKSRGGFLALVAAVLVLFQARFGWWKTLLISAVVLPGLFLLYGGRATEISPESTTAKTRLQLWSEGLEFFKSAPVFGIGEGMYAEVSEDHLVAHNSFVQNFAELGFFGGSIFIGAFYLALWYLYRLGKPGVRILDPDLLMLRPFLTTIVGGYTMGLMSLSRAMVPPTYMVVGLATAYLGQVVSVPPLTQTRFSARLVLRLLLVSAAVLAAIYLYVRSNVEWS
jgi:hypothetical protein